MGATILTITPPEGLGETVAENPKEVFTLRHLDELDGWKTLTDAGHIPPECSDGDDLPEFLNAEDDNMGFLVNPETGDRISWSGEAV